MFIYFLLKDEKVVYVGKTKNVKRRLNEHKGKVFDDYKLLKCTSDESSFLEDKYITKFDPKYNNSLNSKGEYKSLELFCKENNLKIEKAREIYKITPYINPVFNENFHPYTLNALKAIYEESLGAIK